MLQAASRSQSTGDAKEDDLFTGSERVYGHLLQLILFVEVSESTVRQGVTDCDRSHLEIESNPCL
ncbi:hypothetical protein CUMW_206390 [Citrus unshiu]|uniref:Uncharacterized protein n=1 Tax=Citrus unshiu TaxID=55188 RepID=A0A2H5Q8L5_CITUN|nr:hypothetical protein CUMW_206390 [Citrus unshiu]